MEHEILVCACGTIDHSIIVTYDKEDKLVYVNTRIKPDDSFLERVKRGFKYIFNINRYNSDYAEILLDERHIEKLQKIIDLLNERRRENEVVSDNSSESAPEAE